MFVCQNILPVTQRPQMKRAKFRFGPQCANQYFIKVIFFFSFQVTLFAVALCCSATANRTIRRLLARIWTNKVLVIKWLHIFEIWVSFVCARCVYAMLVATFAFTYAINYLVFILQIWCAMHFFSSSSSNTFTLRVPLCVCVFRWLIEFYVLLASLLTPLLILFAFWLLLITRQCAQFIFLV